MGYLNPVYEDTSRTTSSNYSTMPTGTLGSDVMSGKMDRIIRCLAVAILLPIAISTSSCAVWAHEQDGPHHDDGVGVTFRAEGVFETIADGWQVQDIGFAAKPSFDCDAVGRLHVMGMTE